MPKEKRGISIVLERKSLEILSGKILIKT